MRFEDSVIYFIDRHGVDVVLKKSTSTYDPSTGTASGTESSITVKSYPKHIKASQYYHPNLIGKDAVMFYLKNQGFTVENSMQIEYNGKTYIVDSYSESVAFGKVIMYRVLGIRA